MSTNLMKTDAFSLYICHVLKNKPVTNPTIKRSKQKIKLYIAM